MALKSFNIFVFAEVEQSSVRATAWLTDGELRLISERTIRYKQPIDGINAGEQFVFVLYNTITDDRSLEGMDVGFSARIPGTQGPREEIQEEVDKYLKFADPVVKIVCDDVVRRWKEQFSRIPNALPRSGDIVQ